MEKNLIPLATLGISCLIGCASEPIIGDWELTSIEIEDMDMDGLKYTYEVDGQDDYCGNYALSYTMTFDASMTVDENLLVEMEMTTDYSSSFESANCPSESESGTDSSDYSGEVTANDDGTYDVELEGDEDDLELECTINDAGDELECEDDQDEVSVTFSKKG